jgi:hypothetical protein
MSTRSQDGEKQRRRLHANFLPRTVTSRQQSPKPKFAIPVGHHHGASERYKQALAFLKDTLESKNEKWGSFDIPKLEEGATGLDAVAFQKGLQSICETYIQKHDRGCIEKCAHAIECCFNGLAPFMKNALEIAKEGAAV